MNTAAFSSNTGLGKLLLNLGLFCGVKTLSEHVCDDLSGVAAGAMAATIVSGAQIFARHSGELLAEVFKDRFADQFNQPGVHGHPAHRLNHDLERALARAGTRTLVLLIREWERHPPTERGVEEIDGEVLQFARQCECWLKEHGRNAASETITAWVETLNQSDIRAFADIEPDQLLTNHRSGDFAASKPMVGGSVNFRQWFFRHFPNAFELHFWDELKTDTRAWVAFQGGLHKRTLELLKQANDQQSAELKRISAQLTQLSFELARPSTPNAVPDTALLDAAISRTMAELNQSNAALRTAICADLSDELLAVAGLINDHTTREVDRVIAVVRKEIQHPARLTLRPWHPPVGAVEFFGRGDEVKEVARLLTEQRLLALIGPGGMGKTALAAAVVKHLEPQPERPRVFTGGIYSHDYYQLAGHPAALSSILGQAGLDQTPDADRPGVVKRLLNNPGVLLYLEGCEKAENLYQLLSLIVDATVLLTTREPDKAGGAHAHQVKRLDQEFATKLLAHHAGLGPLPTDPATNRPWNDLADRLGGHPLALRLAGVWLKNRKQDPAAFLRRLTEDGFQFWNTNKEPKENLHVLFDHTTQAVLNKHERALEAWFVLSLHGHAPVPLTILATLLGCDDDRADDVFDALREYSLAEPCAFPSVDIGQTERAWQLTHALLVEWGRDALCAESGMRTGTPDSQDAPQRISPYCIERIFEAWHKYWYDDLEHCVMKQRAVTGGPARYQALQPHWQKLVQILKGRLAGKPDEFSNILALVHKAHFYMGNLSAARPLIENCLEIRRGVRGLEDQSTLKAMTNLGQLLCYQRELDRADSILQQCLKIQETILGPEHEDTLICLNHLAHVLRNKGQNLESERLMRRCLDGRRRVLGPEARHTLDSQNGLGIILLQPDRAGAVRLNRMLEAEHLFRATLEVQERIFGQEHDDTLRIDILKTRNHLGNLLKEKRDYAAAESLLKRVLEDRTLQLGIDHHNTLESMHNLGDVYERSGQYALGKALLMECFELRVKRLGWDHRDTLNTLRLLMIVLEKEGSLIEEAGWLTRHLEEAARKLGASDPRILSGLNHLVGLLNTHGEQAKEDGDLPRAEAHYRCALEVRERVVGPEHRDTLSSLNKLAGLFKARGDLAVAEPLYRRAVNLSERVLGPQHPNTLKAITTLGGLLAAKGDMIEAEQLHRRALEARERLLGRDHQDTLISVNNLAKLLVDKRDFAGAKPLAERAAQGFLAKRGPDDPHTKMAQEYLAKIRREG